MSAGRVDRHTLQRRLVEGSALVLGLSALLLVPARIGPFPFPWPLALIWVAYSWSAAGPTIRATIALFILGLWHDALTGGPIGAWVLIGFAAYGAALAQRRWVAFEGQAASFAGCGLAAIAAGFATVLLAAVQGSGGASAVFFAQLAITVMLFPMVAGWFAVDSGEDET